MELEEVKSLMESSQTLEEWDANCEKVRGECGGYPPFWYGEIVSSGLADKVAARWGGDAKIRIASITTE